MNNKTEEEKDKRNLKKEKSSVLDDKNTTPQQPWRQRQQTSSQTLDSENATQPVKKVLYTRNFQKTEERVVQPVQSPQAANRLQILREKLQNLNSDNAEKSQYNNIVHNHIAHNQNTSKTLNDIIQKPSFVKNSLQQQNTHKPKEMTSQIAQPINIEKKTTTPPVSTRAHILNENALLRSKENTQPSYGKILEKTVSESKSNQGTGRSTYTAQDRTKNNRWQDSQRKPVADFSVKKPTTPIMTTAPIKQEPIKTRLDILKNKIENAQQNLNADSSYHNIVTKSEKEQKSTQTFDRNTSYPQKPFFRDHNESTDTSPRTFRSDEQRNTTPYQKNEYRRPYQGSTQNFTSAPSERKAYEPPVRSHRINYGDNASATGETPRTYNQGSYASDTHTRGPVTSRRSFTPSQNSSSFSGNSGFRRYPDNNQGDHSTQNSGFTGGFGGNFYNRPQSSGAGHSFNNAQGFGHTQDPSGFKRYPPRDGMPPRPFVKKEFDNKVMGNAAVKDVFDVKKTNSHLQQNIRRKKSNVKEPDGIKRTKNFINVTSEKDLFDEDDRNVILDGNVIINNEVVQKANEWTHTAKNDFENFDAFETTYQHGNRPTQRRHFRKKRAAQTQFPAEIHIGNSIFINDLAEMLKMKTKILRRQFAKDQFNISENGYMEGDMVQIVLEKWGIKVIRELSIAEKIDILLEEWRQKSQKNVVKKLRPPVVTIMGHVNHGKTTLLDCLAETSFADKEAGKITQNITAYYIPLDKYKKNDGVLDAICFVDTPGHEFFGKTRERGSDISDIVLLLISLVEGIQEQTLDALRAIQQNNKPFIVVYTKSDQVKPENQAVAQQKIAHALLQHNVIVESLSGTVPEAMISSVKKTGIQELLETISIYSEFLTNLLSSPSGLAKSKVLEVIVMDAEQWVGAIIMEGEIKIGDTLLAGNELTRVRNLKTFQGLKKTSAKAGEPIFILGFKDPLDVGSIVCGVPGVKEGRYIIDLRKKMEQEEREKSVLFEQSTKSFKEINKEDNQKNTQWFFESFATMHRKTKDFCVFVKANTAGLLEDLLIALSNIRVGSAKQQEIVVSIQESGIGPVTPSDIEHCVVNKSFLIIFGQKLSKKTEQDLEKNQVPYAVYDIIHTVTEDIKTKLYNQLPDVIEEKILGKGVIVQIFNIPSHGLIIGCSVEEGTFTVGAKVRLFRKDLMIGEGFIRHLKQNKKDIESAGKGIKCGVLLRAYQGTHEVDDIVHVIEEIKKRPDLS